MQTDTTASESHSNEYSVLLEHHHHESKAHPSVESGVAKHKIPKSRVDLLFASRLKKITFAISTDRNILLTILGLLLMTFGQTWVISYTGSVIGGFYQTIVTSNIDGFYSVLWKSVLVVLGSAIFDSSIKYVTE
jgi:hypothetical protein